MRCCCFLRASFLLLRIERWAFAFLVWMVAHEAARQTKRLNKAAELQLIFYLADRLDCLVDRATQDCDTPLQYCALLDQ